MKILFAGGGTGGHFFPILAVIQELKKIAEEEQILDLSLYYMGPDDFGKHVLIDEQVIFIKVPTGKERNYFSLQNFLDYFKTAFGVIKAFWHMVVLVPDIVFSKGGYGAFPAVLAAIILKIPIIIHESDAVPGKVNKLASSYAKRIGIAFASAERYFPKGKTAVVGIPIRKHLLGGSREHAKERFNIFTNVPVIGFIGGSQGSQRINEAVFGILKELTEKFEVIHLTGEKNFEEVKAGAALLLEKGNKERYHPFGFLDEDGMRDFYGACDFIISRASATSIYEIASWGKPSILIPLTESAQNHQYKNATEYAASGAAGVIQEANLTPHLLFAEIEKTIQDTEWTKKMKDAAQKFARIDSADIIAREILQLGVHTT